MRPAKYWAINQIEPISGDQLSWIGLYWPDLIQFDWICYRILEKIGKAGFDSEPKSIKLG